MWRIELLIGHDDDERRIFPQRISWHLNTRLACKFLPNLPLIVMPSDVLKSGQLLIVGSSIPPNADSGLVIQLLSFPGVFEHPFQKRIFKHPWKPQFPNPTAMSLVEN